MCVPPATHNSASEGCAAHLRALHTVLQGSLFIFISANVSAKIRNILVAIWFRSEEEGSLKSRALLFRWWGDAQALTNLSYYYAGLSST